MSCLICEKHRHLAEYTGDVIAELDGVRLTHFPFLKDEPATKGRLVLEPLRHITTMSELTDAEACAVGILMHRAEIKLTSVLGAEHVYVFRINDKVPHLHFHLVPRYAGTPREFYGTKILENPGAERVSLEQIKQISRELGA